MSARSAVVLAFCLAAAAAPRPGFRTTFDVRDWGAVGDGKALDTTSIQRAIDACSAAGGGRVSLGSGIFLSGSLILRDGVTLWLEASATLLGSTRVEDYPTGHLIEAEGAERVGIAGQGTIDGQGGAFWDDEDLPRPRPVPWIDFRACRDVTVRDVRLRNSPSHTLYLTRCRRVVVEDIVMDTAFHGPNTDGIDVNGSSEVLIRGCLISTGDDAICLKAKDPDMVVEDVVVSGCVLASDDAALKLGTGSGGTIRRCVFSDTVIRDTRYGIALFMKDGGEFSNIRFDALSIATGTRPDRERYEIPIFMDIEGRTSDSPLGRIRDVFLSDIDITTRGSCLIAGQRERPIENLSISGVTLRVSRPQDMRGQRKPRGTRTLTEPAANDYSRTAAHLVLGHLRGLRMHDVRVLVETSEAGVPRRALWAADLEDAVIDGFEGAPVGDGTVPPAIELINARRVALRSCRAVPGTLAWLHLAGAATTNIILRDNDTASAVVVIDPEVPPLAIDDGRQRGGDGE